MLPTQADAILARARRLRHDHSTRAKRDGAVLDYSLHDLRELLAANRICTYCGQALDWTASLDHATPIARNGRHALSNLLVCCLPCQQAKGALSEPEYRRLLDLLDGFDPRGQTDVLRRLRSGAARYARRRS